MATVTQVEGTKNLGLSEPERRFLGIVDSLPESSQALLLRFAETVAGGAKEHEVRAILDDLVADLRRDGCSCITECLEALVDVLRNR